MKDAPYLNRQEANAARARRANEAHAGRQPCACGHARNVHAGKCWGGNCACKEFTPR